MAELPQGDDWQKGDEENVHEIEQCLCPNCHGPNATTTMLPTKIPLFREIIVMTLVCPDCNFRNTEVSFGGTIQEKGERISLTVTKREDLDRQIVKSDSAAVLLPSLDDLEIPRQTQVGVSTLEGLLRKAAGNLEALQSERLRLGDVDNFHRCRSVIAKLKNIVGDPVDDLDQDDEEDGGKSNLDFQPFKIILDDPAGNSFIENPFAPSPDPNMKSEKFIRTPNQDMALGLQPSEEARKAGIIDDSQPLHKNITNAPKGHHSIEIDEHLRPTSNRSGDGTGSTNSRSRAGVGLGRDEVMKFPTTCPSCHAPADTDMCVTDIPHFKEVIIMCLLCERCGYKSNEIKGGGAIPTFGTKITLRVCDARDLAREVLKSDTAGIAIPELDLELDEGGLDGLYTTVEGLIMKMHNRLKEANPFGTGDASAKQHLANDGGTFSSPKPEHVKYAEFLRHLKDMAEGRSFPFTLVISDPLSNSFVGPIPDVAAALSIQAEKEGSMECYDKFVDESMDIEEYERTDDQNEILGLNDMKTENYQTVTNIGDCHEGKETEYYGTDKLEELPDRLRRLDHRGPDHPHAVGMAPVEGDTTIMGTGTKTFAVPSIQQRGRKIEIKNTSSNVANGSCGDLTNLMMLLEDWEEKDSSFEGSDTFLGSKQGKVFRKGKRGVGYYSDISLEEVIKGSRETEKGTG